MIKNILFTIIFLISAVISEADNVKFSMNGPNVISVGEQFRLSFSLNERGNSLQLPDMSNFDILMGPSTSQSSSIQIINGKTTQSVTFSYTFILRAKKEGSFTIRPASIKVDGKVYESNELSIQVVKKQASQTTTGQQQGSNATSTNISNENLFVKVELDKRNVFKSEQIIATVKIYVAPTVPISNFENIKTPSYSGFWTQEIDIPNQISFTREVFKNKIYQVGILKKTILFPQQIGKIKIDPVEITCLVRQRVSRQRSFFDDFFDNSYRNIRAKVISDAITVNIKELPTPPAGFYGGVGKLNFSASLDKTNLKANEAATIKINITGTGNLRLIEAPKIDFPADFEVYDPKTNERITATESGIKGNKTFEYLFIPRFAGEYTIPPIKFTSFNPTSRKYIQQQSAAFTLQVEKGDANQSTIVTSAYSKEDVRFIGKDIRFIKQGQYKLRNKESTFFGSLFFYLIYIVLFISFLTLTFIYRKKLKENANVLLVKNKKANKVARKRLKIASNHLKQNNEEEFYEAVLKSFWGYLSDKLSIPVSDLNRENATESLIKRQVTTEVVNDFIQIVDTCEFARYAPSAVEGTKENLFNKAASLMGKLEKQIR